MRRYNAARSPEKISLERTLEEGQSINNNSNDKTQTNYQVSNLRRRKALLLLFCILFFVIVLLRITTNFISSQQGADIKRYGPAINTTNPFISKFESTLLTDDLRLNNNFWVPLIYNTKDNKLLCREKHRNQLSRFRSRSYTQMIRTYLTSSSSSSNGNNNINMNIFNTTTETTTAIPILIMDADGNGCNIYHHRDDYGYPRLAWSELHNAKHGEYCNAISMPSYETWRYHHSTHKVSSDWESTFITNEYHYPWNTKIKKAIWRGSTTYEGSQYGNAELKDTPRGQLVTIASGTSLIDAGFTKINQKFSKQKNELKDQFNIAKRLHPSDMMKYKGMFSVSLLLVCLSTCLMPTYLFDASILVAVIDIDGNNWSSRFGTLLCSNSVVIKVR